MMKGEFVNVEDSVFEQAVEQIAAAPDRPTALATLDAVLELINSSQIKSTDAFRRVFAADCCDDLCRLLQLVKERLA